LAQKFQLVAKYAQVMALYSIQIRCSVFTTCL